MAAVRMTGKRCNGIKEGYWTWETKDKLVQKLGEYEDTGLTPKQVKMLMSAVPDVVKEVQGGR